MMGFSTAVAWSVVGVFAAVAAEQDRASVASKPEDSRPPVTVRLDSGSEQFRIPFAMPGKNSDRIHRVRLYVSTDQGEDWEPVVEVNPARFSAFPFTLRGDGLYWFQVQVVSNDGTSTPEEASWSSPALIVQVGDDAATELKRLREQAERMERRIDELEHQLRELQEDEIRPRLIPTDAVGAQKSAQRYSTRLTISSGSQSSQRSDRASMISPMLRLSR